MPTVKVSAKPFWRFSFLVMLSCAIFSGCHWQRAVETKPVVQITVVPPAAEGGAERTGMIEGTTADFRPGQQIVIYARSGIWWVQPMVANPKTEIQPDGAWKNSTHYGTEYAALLVREDYNPPSKIDELPTVGDKILAIATAKGAERPDLAGKSLKFSGYDWKIRTVVSERGGRNNKFDPANAWTDANGFLHLRLKHEGDKWTCAEINLMRSLGYGTYNFVVRDVSQLDPAAVFGMFTWDDLDANQNHREMDIEISRWGDASNKNMQYVVQPYFVPANVARFEAPAGLLMYSFKWEPGRVTFKTFRGAEANYNKPAIAEHVLTSGIPTPEKETVHLNLYTYAFGKSPIQKENEVIIEKFEFLP